MTLPLTATGRYGKITFDGTFVTLTRTKIGQSITGMAEKTIHVKDITGISFKPASRLLQGRIAFTLAGGQERRGSNFANRNSVTGSDENGMLFFRKALPEFEALKNAIQAAQAEIR